MITLLEEAYPSDLGICFFFSEKSGKMNVTSYMAAAKGLIRKIIIEYYLKK
jgi:hypothetical protein